MAPDGGSEGSLSISSHQIYQDQSFLKDPETAVLLFPARSSAVTLNFTDYKTEITFRKFIHGRICSALSRIALCIFLNNLR
jgi:hypothetical protein